MADIKFQDHTQTNFTFPVTISYDADSDPSGAVITDLARKCGVDPTVAATQVTVSVDIEVSHRCCERCRRCAQCTMCR